VFEDNAYVNEDGTESRFLNPDSEDIFFRVALASASTSGWAREGINEEKDQDEEDYAESAIKRNNADNIARDMRTEAHVNGDTDYERLANSFLNLGYGVSPLQQLMKADYVKNALSQSDKESYGRDPVFAFIYEGDFVTLNAANLFSEDEQDQLLAAKGISITNIDPPAFLDGDEVRRRLGIFMSVVDKMRDNYSEGYSDLGPSFRESLTDEEREIYKNVQLGISSNSLDTLPVAVSSSEKYAKLGDPKALINTMITEVGTSTLVKQWAATSNGNDPLSLAMQELVGEMFNLKNPSPWIYRYEENNLQSQIDMIKQSDREVLSDFLRIQYERTQANFKQFGVTEVYIHRGFGAYGDLADTVRNASDTISVSMRPLSSWSTSKDVARGFQYEESFGSGTGYMSTVVPTSRVFSMPGSGFGCSNEYELVLLGGELVPDRLEMSINKNEELTEMLQNFKRYDLMGLARSLETLIKNNEASRSPRSTDLLRETSLSSWSKNSGDNSIVMYRAKAGSIYDMLKKLYESGNFPGFATLEGILTDSLNLG
jgi:hypothetical protein